MTGCAAPDCTNHTRYGFITFHRFPSDPDRRRQWLINCQRDKWTPTENDRLCSLHFEDSQYEQKRVDGKKRLTPFAIPTIFNVLKKEGKKGKNPKARPDSLDSDPPEAKWLKKDEVFEASDALLHKTIIDSRELQLQEFVIEEPIHTLDFCARTWGTIIEPKEFV